LYTGVQDGWFDLIYDLSSSLEQLILELPEEDRKDYFVVQVKEKFAGLRFYLNACPTDKMQELISEAERRSYYTCEKTGNPGRRFNVLGWIKTLSPEAFVSEIISRRNSEMHHVLKDIIEARLDDPNEESIAIEQLRYKWAKDTLERWKDIDANMKAFCEKEGLLYY
jgi:hypothetical protein